MIYVAAPYTSKLKHIREKRYNRVTLYTLYLINYGETVYSPITMWHPVAKLLHLPIDAEFWWAYNKQMIKQCEEMHILRLMGWATSEGIQQEKEYAESLRLPILDVNWSQKFERITHGSYVT